MSATLSILATKTNRGLLSFNLFSIPLKSFWSALLLVIMCVELIPMPVMPPLPLYLYCAAKALIFFAIGYLAPLSFSGFNAMSRGAFWALGSAVLIEILQGLGQHGHTFHFLELAAKLILTFVGFGCGIVTRYDQSISFLGLRITLTEKRS